MDSERAVVVKDEADPTNRFQVGERVDHGLQRDASGRLKGYPKTSVESAMGAGILR